MIQQLAKKCRYCGEWLPEEQEMVKIPTSSCLQEKISSPSLVDSNKPTAVSATQSTMPKQVFPPLHNVIPFAKCSKFFEVTTILFMITIVLTLGANILAAEYGNLTLQDAGWFLQYCEAFSQLWFGGLFTFIGTLMDDVVWAIAMVMFLLQIKKYNRSLPIENQIGNLWLWLAVITTCVASIFDLVDIEVEENVTLFISLLFIFSFLFISWQIFKRWRSTRKDYLLGVCLGLMLLVSTALALFSSKMPVAVDNFLQNIVPLICWVWLYFHIAHDYILDYQQDSLAGVQPAVDEQLASMRIFRHDILGLNPIFQKVMGRYNQREEIQSIVDKMNNDIKFPQSISVPMSSSVTIPNVPQPASAPAVSSMGESPATNEQSNASPNEQTSYLSFGKAISTCFRKYAKFSGRASRSEFWWWALFVNLLLPLPLLLMFYIPIFIYMHDGYSYFDAIMMRSFTIEDDVNFYVVLGLCMFMLLITFLPSLAVTVRRLHDVGVNGWYLLFLLLPILGPLFLLTVLIERSKDVSSCTSQDSAQEKPE